MDLPGDYDHPALRRGAEIEVMDAGIGIGHATVGEPGRSADGLSFTADGLYRDLERFLCFDDEGETTTIVDEAVDQAIGRGLRVVRPESLATNAMKTDSVSEGLNYLDSLVSSLAEESGEYWWVDAKRALRMAPAETTPKWHLTPGFAVPGIDDSDYASHLFARYLSGSTLVTRDLEDTAASQRWGKREAAVDLTALGSISTGRVDNRLAGLLQRGRARLRFTDRFEVSAFDLLTAGGRPSSLSMVRNGDVMRVHGLSSYSQWLSGRPYLDVVLGEVVWQVGAQFITLAPVDFAGKSLTDRLTNRGAVALTA